MAELDRLYQYPTLFHKFLVGASSVGPPTYEIIQDLIRNPTGLPENCICHFHIFDLDQFDEFKTGVELIGSRMPLVITYCLGSSDVIKVQTSSLGILKIPNQGYDIGAKMCCLNYLERKEIQFEYMLLLHSKTDPIRRLKYCVPFIKSTQRLDLILTLLQMKQTNLLGIFPETIWYDYQGYKNYPNDNLYHHNWSYYREIIAYIGCTNSDKIFAEGNSMILHRTVIDFVWGSKMELFYPNLNFENSFDWNWFKIYYPQHRTKSIQEAYWFYQVNHLWGNNIPIKTEESSIPDGMLEHVFERIWINVIRHLGGQYLILNESNIIETYKIKINTLICPRKLEGSSEKLTLDLEARDAAIKSLEEQACKYGLHGLIMEIPTFGMEWIRDSNFTFPFALVWTFPEPELILTCSDLDPARFIPIFRRPNYLRTINGECIFYLHRCPFDEAILNSWQIKFARAGLKVKIIMAESKASVNTEMSSQDSSEMIRSSWTQFMWEPAYTVSYLTSANPNYMVQNGIVTSDNFDFKYYLDCSPDVRAILGENYRSIYEHFLGHGIREKRPFRFNSPELEIRQFPYTDLIRPYQGREYSDSNQHLSIPLSTVTPRSELCLDLIEGNSSSFRKMLYTLLGTILLRHTCDLGIIVPCDHLINVTGWDGAETSPDLEIVAEVSNSI